jgi:pentatricopeptide repeat protein
VSGSGSGSPSAAAVVADKDKWIADTIQAANAGKRERVLRRYEDLRRLNVRDSDMWSATLHSLLQLRQPGEGLDAVVGVYNSMLDRGISPTPGAVKRLIQNLAWRDIEIHKALEWMNRWEEENTPGMPSVSHQEQRARFAREDNFAPAMALIAATYARRLPVELRLPTYDTLLECCTYRADVKSAIQVYAHMERAGVRPDAKTFTMLLRTYAAAKDMEGAIEVFSEFRIASRNGKMKWADDGEEQEQEREPGRQAADPASRETRAPAAAAEAAAEEDGLKPLSPRAAAACTTVWNTMIRTYFECNNPAGALSLLEKMMDSNVGLHFTASDVPLPSGQTFGDVIRGFIDTADIHTALAWFKRLLEQTDAPPARADVSLLTPTRPDRATWHAMLHGLYQNKMAEEVNELVMLADALGHPDTQLHPSHLNWVWRTNLVVIQDPATSKERAGQLLDFLRTTVVERELRHEPERVGAGAKADARIWQCVGLYVAQRRIDDALALLFLAHGRQRALVDQAGEDTLGPLERIRNLLRSFEASVLDTAAPEGGCFPSFANLLEYLRIYDEAGLMPPQRAGWYYLNAFLHHHEQPMDALPDGAWPRLAAVAVATCQSVFWEAQAPVADANHVWQVIAFLQIAHRHARGFEALGSHNVHRIHQILLHHLGEARTRDVYASLGSRFANVEDYLPRFVKVAARAQAEPHELLAASRPADLAPHPVPLRIDVAASKWVAEGSAFRRPHARAQNNVTPAVAFARLETCVARGQGIHPEELARLVLLLGQARAPALVHRAYAIGQHILAVLHMNRAWQAAGWFALEDAMVGALAHCGDMDAAAVHRARIVQYGGVPSANAYGALIANIRETTDNASVATELFDEACRLGVRPHEYMFNTYISRLARARKTEQALAVFSEFKARGLRPTMVTYGAILSGCARVGDTVNAEALFQEMINSECGVPRIPPFNTMIQMYVHVKPNRDRALHYFDLLKQHNVLPTSYTYKVCGARSLLSLFLSSFC